MNNKETLYMKRVGDFEFQFTFNGTKYRPTDDTTFAGALIFALKPQAFDMPAEQRCTQFKLMADIAVWQLKGHVKGRLMPKAALENWRAGLISLAYAEDDAADLAFFFDGAVMPANKFLERA